ncbi:hypothetical protein IMPR6_310015 [Imperialibacter sp. EC-SDR9]|nr:hypothetical protein IMPR6_310015 [Imperialibacter sp. EC-SDR9]
MSGKQFDIEQLGISGLTFNFIR